MMLRAAFFRLCVDECRFASFRSSSTYYKQRWADKVRDCERRNPVRGRNREIFVAHRNEEYTHDNVLASLHGVAMKQYQFDPENSLLNPPYMTKGGHHAQQAKKKQSNQSKDLGREAEHFGKYTSQSNGEMQRIMNTVESSNDCKGSESPYIRLSENGRDHPVFWYEAKLEKMLMRNQTQEAYDFLINKTIEEDRVMPSAFMFNIVISGFSKTGDMKIAFKLYNKMKKMGLQPDSRTYSSLFKVCAVMNRQNSNLDQVKLLLGSIREKNFEMNYINYVAAVRAFGLNGDMETAFSLADECSDVHGLCGDMYIALLMSCAKDNNGGFGMAIKVWRQMRKKRVTVTTAHYNNLLRCVKYCGVRDMDAFLETVQIQEDKQPRVTGGENCAALVDTNELSEEAALTTGHSQLADILNAKLKFPADITIGDVNSGTDRLILLGGVTGILRRMEVHKCQPDIKTFTFLLDCLPKENSAEDELLKIMENLHFTPDSGFMTQLMLRRGLRGDITGLGEAMTLLEKLDIPVNQRISSILALGCNTPERSSKLLQHMEGLGLQPDLETFNAMLRNCHHSNFEMKIFVLETMNKYAVRPDYKIIKSLREKLLDCKQQLIVQERTDEIVEHEIEANALREYQDLYTQWMNERRLEKESVAISS